MDPRLIPQMIAALAFFGLIVICPLVLMLLRHQRHMADLIHGKAESDSLRRLETVERELRELKAAHNEQALRADDDRALSQRIT